jgi:ATP-dependent RNA helicase RhlB
MELAYEHMNDAVRVEIEPERVTARGIRERLYHVPTHEKLPLLLGLLERDKWERTLIFVNRKTTAADLVAALSTNGYPVSALAGNVKQLRRMRILQDFKEGKASTLIATDVASRGLHIDGVTHVINFDLPQDPEDYVHRIGRTARAGAEGDAISFADEEYVFSLDAIEKLIGRRIPAEVADPALYRHPEARSRMTRPHRSSGPGPRAPRGPHRPPASRGPQPHVHRPAPAPAPEDSGEGGMGYGRSKRKARR